MQKNVSATFVVQKYMYVWGY